MLNTVFDFLCGLEYFRACYTAWDNLTKTFHIYVGLFSISRVFAETLDWKKIVWTSSRQTMGFLRLYIVKIITIYC